MVADVARDPALPGAQWVIVRGVSRLLVHEPLPEPDDAVDLDGALAEARSELNLYRRKTRRGTAEVAFWDEADARDFAAMREQRTRNGWEVISTPVIPGAKTVIHHVRPIPRAHRGPRTSHRQHDDLQEDRAA